MTTPRVQVDDVRRPVERLLGLLLDLDVDRQLERVTGDRLLIDRNCARDPARRVALDLLVAVRAAQIALERRLDPGLADLSSDQIALILELR